MKILVVVIWIVNICLFVRSEEIIASIYGITPATQHTGTALARTQVQERLECANKCNEDKQCVSYQIREENQRVWCETYDVLEAEANLSPNQQAAFYGE